MLVIGPVADLDVTILKILQGGDGELSTLGNNLSTGIVLHTQRGLALCQGHQLLDQNILQIIDLCLILLVNLSQRDLVLLLGLTGLHGTGEEFLIDDDTSQ